jgi:hypothetical protein
MNNNPAISKYTTNKDKGGNFTLLFIRILCILKNI